MHVPCRMLPRTVCLRLRNFVLLLAMRATRAARAAHSRFVLTAWSIHVLSEILQLFSIFLLHAPRYALAATAPPCPNHVLLRFALVLPLRACAGRLRRHNCALRARRALCTSRLPYHCRLPQGVFVPIGVSISLAV
jgi:hypothetical protein